MAMSDDLIDQVSRATLERFLAARGEADPWDFKLTVDLSSAKGRAELAKDILAFANTAGGGHLILGVSDKTYDIVGISDDLTIDTTAIFNAISRFISIDLTIAASE